MKDMEPLDIENDPATQQIIHEMLSQAADYLAMNEQEKVEKRRLYYHKFKHEIDASFIEEYARFDPPKALLRMLVVDGAVVAQVVPVRKTE